jgi:hypothetical protein
MHDYPLPFRSSPLFATPHAFLCTGTRVPYVGAEPRESPGPDPKNRRALEGPAEAEGPDRLAATMREVLTKSLTLRGFINYEFAKEHYSQFLQTVSKAIADGRVRYLEDITDGLENAPGAFIGMLEGRNFGKALVRVAL